MAIAIENLTQAERILNQAATELVLAQPGSDEGLVPTYSLLCEFHELVQDVAVVRKSTQALIAGLDKLLDDGLPFDETTLQAAQAFAQWGQEALLALNLQKEIPACPELFPKAEPENQPPEGEIVWQPGEEIEPKADDYSKEAHLAAVQAKSREVEDDELLVINLDDDREILEEFHTEALEHLESIESTLLTIENDPQNEEGLASLFRSFHTLKGVAGFLHLTPIQFLAHDVESLLDHARNGRLKLNSGLITLILSSRDTIQALVGQVTDALRSGMLPSEIIPINTLRAQVRVGAEAALAGKKTEPAERKTPPTVAEAPNGSSIANGAAKTIERATIRVDTNKLDNLLDMVGELVIVQSQLTESMGTETGENTPLQRNVNHLRRITRELQHTSMSLRLVPVKPTFQRVGRLVRDLATACEKPVRFEVDGEETELDRNVVEQIADPLIHMVRNSIDHGIEAEADRLTAGKERSGLVKLSAYHQGGRVVIELKDDGRGLNDEKILAKARSRGLLADGQEISRQELYRLIFEPGFSTAEKVTDVSGRGVGMDVVRRNVEKLRGSVELDSEPNAGTTFKIKLPLTTAIIDGLIVRVGEDRFILPTTSVEVALKPEKSQITRIQGKAEVMDWRGRNLPVIYLSERFGIPAKATRPWEGIVVVLETVGRPVALLVDELLSKQEVVIKNLGNLMQNVQGVAGGAILGDGSIALILDPASLGRTR